MTTVRVPAPRTLRLYGLDEPAWRAILDYQGGVCGICQTLPSTGALVIDHEHVRGWKTMPAEERVQYVRGILCWQCNYFLVNARATTEKLIGAARYLSAYHWRKESE